MITKKTKTKFEKYKDSLPKDSLCVIMQDTEEGLIDFMSYDTTDKHEASTGYIILRVFMEMLETQIENIIMHGQAAIFKDLEIIKPEMKDKVYSKDNITVLDFNSDK